ncbi:hypothetical protein EJ03DRAFT_358939 [Teratosphaeria nubilosa]|uniref:Uncharacterized protein n=1 Tax=Teratosphaeria nubilosa TaxID=161662 RepID=A0A6G1LFD1_9PEZI|nr:hypothetical protein EJ03DRAFT_358939 [Teratosphaeria nubilosa]
MASNHPLHQPLVVQSDKQVSIKNNSLDYGMNSAYPLLRPLVVECAEQGSIKDTRAKIKNLVDRYKTANNPPFSVTQLVVMILMLHDSPLSIEDMCSWLFDNFLHYQDTIGQKVSNLKKSMMETAWHFEVPVSLVPHFPPLLKVDFRKGERPLDGLIGEVATPKDAVCRFCELPGELRNKIYEMVFAYPQAGISPHKLLLGAEGEAHSGACYSEPSYRMVLLTPNRDYNEPFSKTAWPTGPHVYTASNTAGGNYLGPPRSPYGEGNILRIDTIAQILDCLGTSKQFYYEARSFFFTNNHFYFQQPTDLVNALSALHAHKPK